MENIKCKECDKTFKSVDSVRRHRVQKHGISAEQTYVDYMLNGKYPTCGCGCGDSVNFLSIKKGFVDYGICYSILLYDILLYCILFYYMFFCVILFYYLSVDLWLDFLSQEIIP